MRQHEGSLPGIVEQQARENDRQPGEHDRLAPEMAEIGIERLGAGDGQEDGADGDEGDVRRIDQEGNDIVRADRQQDFRVVDDVVQAGKPDGQEPYGRHRAEHQAHAARAEPLHREHHGENEQSQRHHIGLERWRDDIHALDRGKHRDCRRDDGVTKKQRCADDADAEDDRRARRETAARQRHQRQHAALAAVVRAQHEHNVFDGNDDRQRPDDQRQHAENIAALGDIAAGRSMQCLAKRIDRTGADVAIDHAERPQHQHLGAMLLDFRMARLVDGFCLTTSVGKGHKRHSDKRAVLYACCNAISSAPTLWLPCRQRGACLSTIRKP